ncbi:TatD family hydrolase [Candidatus Pacearchaeota archaeon]|nr:TatD family hydrolase [Candidatus Pacearchaeota archaeon]
MNLIDVHCHLDICDDIEGVLERAKASEVKKIITNGINLDSNKKALELSLKYPEIKSAIGLYPIDALSLNEKEINEIISFIKGNSDKIIAIGEVGLDFKEDDKQHERQKEIFKIMIKLSKDLDKPIIVHSRRAEKECIEILEEMQVKKVIMHCFSGRKNLIARIVANKWFISVPTNAKYSRQFQQMAYDAPLTQIFCETDSPFLHPDKLKNNEPSFIIESYKIIAAKKGISLQEVSEIIERNYNKLFSHEN